MSQQLFEVELGIAFGGASIIADVDSPTGTGLSSSVGVGSIFHNTTSGELWIKKIAGSGQLNWSKIALYSDITNRSWREPVTVVDSTSIVIPVGVATETITIDGVVIDGGASVLFKNTTITTNRNVYIYDKVTGTFIEELNQETAGDQVFVLEGTSAGKSFAFNSNTNEWIQNDSSSLDEEGYVRAFVGKSGVGNVLPTYTSNNYIADGDTLQTAIGKLDGSVASQEVLLGTARFDSFESTVTTQRAIDSVFTEQVIACKWILYIQGTSTNRELIEILALHNGTPTSNATIVPDYTKYAKLKFGTITDLDVSVGLIGTGTTQEMQLLVSSTMPVDVWAIREVINW